MNVAWLPDKTTPRGIVVFSREGAGRVEVDWGDGTETTPVWPGMGPVPHTYPQAGFYMLTTTDTAGGLERLPVAVRDNPPDITVGTIDGDPQFPTLRFTDPTHVVTRYSVRWPTGDVLTGHRTGDVIDSFRQPALDPGEHEVPIGDVDRHWVTRVTMPVVDPTDPKFTATVDTTTAMRVEVVVTEKRDGPLTVNWGDGATDPVPNDGRVPHTYTKGGTFLIKISYDDGSSESAQFVKVGEKAGPKPTSQLLWMIDPADYLTVWARWIGSGGSYMLRWGDGHETHLPWWKPPVSHTYGDYGRYLLEAENPELGTSKTTWINLPAPEPVPPHGPPRIAVHEKDHNLRARVRVLFAPPSDTDPFDHRSVAHHVDWGYWYGEETVPAGTPYVDHDYQPDSWWPPQKDFPIITVTDLSNSTTTRHTVREVRPTRLTVSYDAQGRPVWEWWGSNLPTKGPGTQYHVWNGETLLATKAPEYENASYFYYDQDFPAEGWCSGDLTTTSGEILATQPVWPHGKAVAAYDWDWTGDPWLLLATPWLYWGNASWVLGFTVDFGDGSPGEYLDARSESQATLPHWYTTSGPVTLEMTPDQNFTPTSRKVGPARVTDPIVNPNDPMTVRLDFQLQDAYHPVRVDWGDGTPVTRRHPAADTTDGRGSLTHTYTEPGTFWITVHAPLQHTVDLPPVTVNRKKTLEGFTCWFGDITEWDGGYSGKFHITNHTPEASAWAVEFHLDEPGALWEVWPHTGTEITRLTGGRWRVTCTARLGARQSLVLGGRVEPPGDPNKYPMEVTARAWTPPGGSNDPDEEQEQDSA